MAKTTTPLRRSASMSRRFDTIVPFSRKNANPNKYSPVSKIIQAALDVEYILPGQRTPQLRPSSFPKCPILDWMKILRHRTVGYLEETKSFGNTYFAEVGTVAHEIIQHYIGNTQKVYGDWKCINTECSHGQDAMDIFNAEGKCIRKGKLTRTKTTNNLCPECERPMHYEELEITMNGITGHVDCILVFDKDNWWVVDYKTTMKSKVLEGKLPEHKHIYQLMAYCYILKFEYGLPIKGFSLVYMPRDNPFYFYEYTEAFELDRHHNKALRILKGEKIKWIATKKTLKTNDLSHIIEAKPCADREQYDEEINYYTPCPLLDICFQPKKLQTYLEKYQQAHVNGATPKMEKFTHVVNVISRHSYNELRAKYAKPKKRRKRRVRGKRERTTT